jgi:RNA polymerase sigma-70 factor (ECF subfamily)
MPENPVKKSFYESDPDVLLMIEFQQGGRAAFENLMRKYYKRVFNFIYRLTGSRELAEDLSQDVFLKVYQAADQYRPRSKFQTWLYTIAKNSTLNELRRLKRPVIPFETEAFSEKGERLQGQVADPAAENSLEELLVQERIKSVQVAIGRLPENQRMAVVLYRYERMNYDEIAQTLGMSVSAVKSLLSRARENLRQYLTRFIHG